jgi:nucleoside-diphosphate-sugar epimerase
MNVLVLGGAGELGSNFAKLCIDMNHEVTILDLTRFYETWRLKELGIQDKIKYVWKSTWDLTTQDIEGYDLLLDCACQADRPLGTSAPKHTLTDNLLGPLTLLECARQIPADQKKPFFLYPSSSVEFLGVPRREQPITESSIPKPTNLYGYSKWMAEELYQTYRRAYGIKAMVIRTGSCYGPMMRTDQFIAQTIIKCLRNQDVIVKSPYATRTYTFTEDVLRFYQLFLKRFMIDPERFDGVIVANGGNKENKPYRTFDVAQQIKQIVGSSNKISKSDYEVGELMHGKPVYQHEQSRVADDLIGWKPIYTLKQGLEATISWWRNRV